MLEETLTVWPAELMAQAGCVVHVGHNGAVAVKYGLIRPEDRSDELQRRRCVPVAGTLAAGTRRITPVSAGWRRAAAILCWGRRASCG